MKEAKIKELSLKQNMFWNSFGSLVYLGCQWLMTVLVVRLTNGYEVAGTLSLAMSIYNMFSALAIYRMYTYQVSDVTHENTIGEYFSFRIITCGIALLCIIAYSATTCASDIVPAIVAYAIYKIASLLIDVLHGLDQQNHRMDYIGKSLTLQGAISLVLFCICQLIALNLTITFICMTTGVVLIGLIYDLPRSSKFEILQLGINKAKVGYLLKHCFPIVVAAIACGAAPSIPRQILSSLDGATALGIYSSVAAPVAIIQMGASYIYNPLLGYFSEAYAKKKTGQLLALLSKTSAGIAAIGFLAAIILGLFGENLLTFMFGDDIASYTYLIIPIIICSVITAYVWFLNDLLVAFRHFKSSFIGNLCAAVLSIPIAYIFIPQFGMNGVSYANIATYTISAIVMLLSILNVVRKQISAGRHNNSQMEKQVH